LKAILTESFLKGLDAVIHADKIVIPDIFKLIRREGGVPDADMRRTFNIGVGLAAVVDEALADEIVRHIISQGCNCYRIGKIEKESANNAPKVIFEGDLSW